MRLRLIACEVLYRELCALTARSPHQVDIGFLPKGLHDIGSKDMCARLQAEVDATDSAKYDRILLGYGLCGNGLVGLRARTLPVILPRAHDCITLFLGSKERYLEYFNANPGVYFKTSGWIERGSGTDEISQTSLAQQGFALTREEMVAKYGEDNADFLMAELTRYQTRYRQFTYIEMGVEPDNRFEAATKEEAARRGWDYAKVEGSLDLLRALVNGDWDDPRFLTIYPGHQVAAQYNETIVTTQAATE